MWGSRPDRETISPMPRVARPTIASTSVSRGRDWSRWRSKNASRRSRSSPSVCSSKEPRNERSWSAIPDASSPENWIGGFGSGDDHVLVTLHAISPEAMTRYSDRLCAWFAEGDAFREIWRQDGMALMEMQDGQPVPTAKVHFGYTDAITTPTIRGGPESYQPDHQEPCEPWLFVLREDAENYVVPEPRALGLNGSFAVFKKVETDVVGFEDFLQSNKDKIDPELLAAKMCGRWRNGVPLALSPETDSPAGGISLEAVERLRVRQCRWFGRSEGDPLSRRRTHTPRQSTRFTGRGPGTTRRQQQFPPADSSRSAVRADL